MTKLKNSNWDQTQKLKLCQNLNFDKYQFMRKRKHFKSVFSLEHFDTSHLDNR